MAWTQADADAVRAAITALATGARVVTITFTGPPERTTQYASVQLAELRALLAEMERQVSGSTSYRRVAFSKGFDCG